MSGYVSELFGLDGRVAVVTGGSRGIGAAIAKGFACAGAEVVAVGRSSQPEWRDFEGVRYESCDITDHEEFLRICSSVFETEAKLDILVSAAGITGKCGDDDWLEDFDAAINVNLRAAYAASRAAADLMARSGGGSIINLTSINSVLAFPDNPGYVASKGGLRMLTKALALDLGPDNIRVNSIAPGYTRTGMTEASYTDPDLYEKRLRRMIIPRWGVAEDIVGAAIFLASDASAYVTGQELFVDGGWTAKGLE